MDRREFEKRLSSLIVPEGTPAPEIEKMVFPIREAIAEMMPKSLFRYRACDERHIDAFENDKIFAVPADWFNDPYDTLVRYDYDGIKKYVDYVASADWLSQLKEYFALGNDFPKESKQIFPDEFWNELRTRVLEISDFKGLEEKLEESKQQLLSLVSTYFPILSVIGKRFSTIACFSEDVQSILMWSHYADSHNGFALEYDFTPTLTKPLRRVALFPVIYSDHRYEASAYLTWALFFVMGIKDNTRRLQDSEVRDFIIEQCGAKSVAEFQRLTMEEQTRIVQGTKADGASIRQVMSHTGWSYRRVREAGGEVIVKS